MKAIDPRLRVWLVLGVVALIGAAAWRGWSKSPVSGLLPAKMMELRADDRLLVLAPHPDDEVIGAGGVIQRALAMRLPVRVVFLTYGDNNEWSFAVYRHHPVLLPKAVQRMGLVRHDEAVAADQWLGLSADQLIFLGYPDFGTLQIWSKHWGRRPPFRSLLTRVTAVPYANARRPGAPYTGEEILRDLTEILREFRPTKVVVSHPADQMPDHLACYLFTMIALWDLDAELRPEVYPYLVHFKRWPRPRGYHPLTPLWPPTMFAKQIDWQALLLKPAEVQTKHTAIQAHRSQFAYSAAYLSAFVKPNELFGDFPPITLGSSGASAGVSPEGAEQKEAPEQLTMEERAAFVGVELRSVRLEGRTLAVSIELSRPLSGTVAAAVYIFGYRRGQPFASMPKLHVRVSPFGETVTDQDQPVAGAATIARSARRLVLRVPLASLGEPDRVLMSARTYLGEVPLDWVSWRVVNLRPDRR